MALNVKRDWPIVALSVAVVIGLIAPLAAKLSTPGFYFEVLLGGLMSGVLYSLVALGFVLIFKASGVFNFAQGAMVLFAALAMARLSGEGLTQVHYWATAALLGAIVGYVGVRLWTGPARAVSRSTTMGAVLLAAIISAVVCGRLFKAGDWPLWLAFAGAAAIMIVFAWLVERLVLRHLVNQEAVVLLMATLGVTYFLDGFGQTVWGSDIYEIKLGLPKTPTLILENMFQGGLLINQEDLVAALIAAILVLCLAVFFQKTPTGRALRAVADDHQAAQSIGIPLNHIWVIVWSVAGFVALVAGMIWGSKLGVQFSLSQVALKALPVVILGGLTSVPGAIIGGLIIGVGEKLAEVFLGPVLVKTFDLAGGGIENWFAYVLALAFLLVRPEGLFGERHIDRV